MKKAALLLTAAFFAFAPLTARAADPTPAPAAAQFTDAQRAEIESIIKTYLVEKNPEILPQVVKVLQTREQAENESKTKSALSKLKDRIYNDPTSPVSGNPKGSLTVVEFFDYQCGYCKLAEAAIENVLAADKDIKFIYKNYPILGPVSTEAARASMASARQGKFTAFHNALMKKKEHLNSELILQIAKETGLDVEKLKKDMDDKAIKDAVESGVNLGREMGVQGTPMFIIGDDIYPGALQEEQLKQAIASARAKAKK